MSLGSFLPRLERILHGEDLDITNLRRESRAYTYEEQKWDVQVRQEMARLQRQHSQERDIRSLVEKSTLSQKQREAILSQLEKEAAVRSRVRKTQELLLSARSLLWVAMCREGMEPLWQVPPSPALHHTSNIALVPQLVDPVLRALELPISGQYALSMWQCMCETVLASSLTTGTNVMVTLYTMLLLSTTLCVCVLCVCVCVVCVCVCVCSCVHSHLVVSDQHARDDTLSPSC